MIIRFAVAYTSDYIPNVYIPSSLSKKYVKSDIKGHGPMKYYIFF